MQVGHSDLTPTHYSSGDLQAHVDRRAHVAAIESLSPRLVELAPRMDPENVAKLLWALGRASSDSSGRTPSDSSIDSFHGPGPLNASQRAEVSSLGAAARALAARVPPCAPSMTAQSCALAAWGMVSLGVDDAVRGRVFMHTHVVNTR